MIGKNWLYANDTWALPARCARRCRMPFESTKVSLPIQFQMYWFLRAATFYVAGYRSCWRCRLGSRVYAQHVCLWRSWRKWTPCYCFPCCLNSDICASLELCKLYRTILLSAGSFWCNDDLCYVIFHLKLCVLAVRSGTSTNAQGLSLFQRWGHYRWYQSTVLPKGSWP